MVPPETDHASTATSAMGSTRWRDDVASGGVDAATSRAAASIAGTNPSTGPADARTGRVIIERDLDGEWGARRRATRPGASSREIDAGTGDLAHPATTRDVNVDMLRPSSVRHLPVPSAHPRSSIIIHSRCRNLAPVIKVATRKRKLSYDGSASTTLTV